MVSEPCEPCYFDKSKHKNSICSCNRLDLYYIDNWKEYSHYCICYTGIYKDFYVDDNDVVEYFKIKNKKIITILKILENLPLEIRRKIFLESISIQAQENFYLKEVDNMIKMAVDIEIRDQEIIEQMKNQMLNQNQFWNNEDLDEWYYLSD